MSRTRRRFSFLPLAAAVLLLAGIGAILMPVLQMDREIRRDVEEYAQLRETASLPAETPSRSPDADAEGNPLACRVQPSAAPSDRFTGADLAACQAQNGDFIAWLSIPGTPIDYPVVRTGDSDYYLNHTFSGRKSYLGTLFPSKGRTTKRPDAISASTATISAAAAKPCFRRCFRIRTRSSAPLTP